MSIAEQLQSQGATRCDLVMQYVMYVLRRDGVQRFQFADGSYIDIFKQGEPE